MTVLVGTKANKRWVTLARWVLGLVFIASALGKIADPAGFADSVAAYRLLPVSTVNVFALVLPWVELIVGLSLINGFALQSGALLAAIMYIVFVGAVVSAMARGLDIECGCFTVAESKVGWELLTRDAALLATSLFVFFRGDPSSPEPKARAT